MNHERSLTERIAQVERKLEIRRERTQRHWLETREHAERGVRWWPLVAGGAALAVGVAAGRSRRPAPAAAVARGGLLATLVALGATALRVALSPAGRALWSAVSAQARR